MSIERKKNPSAFIRNTCAMLQRREVADIVGWSQDGRGFIIHDLARFQNQILPQYFRHQKYTSFVRQVSIIPPKHPMFVLNMYGFHKQRHPISQNYFQHETFTKGQQQYMQIIVSLSEIKRKPQKKKKGFEEMKQTSSQQPQRTKEIKPDSAIELSQNKIVKKEAEEQQRVDDQSNLSDILTIDENLSFFSEQAIFQNQILRQIHPLLLSKCLQMRKERVKNMRKSVENALWENCENINNSISLLRPLGEMLHRQITKLESLSEREF